MNVINNFRDPEYSFLMNSYVVDILFDGSVYPSLEHAFQAAKTDDPYDRDAIKQASSARKAKQIGRAVSLREEWDDIRLDIMSHLLDVKFKDSELRTKLLSTKDAELISGGDKFWGKVDDEGENNLGKMLMNLRKKIAEEMKEKLNVSLRDYLMDAGWVRDTSGDGFFGECWTPPWDVDCQYSLIDAVYEQRKVTENY